MQGQLHKATQEWASLFTNLPLKKWWRAAPTWVSFILVVLVAKSTADLTWIIFAPDEVIVASKPQMSTIPVSRSPQPRLRTVANLHLFGEVNRTATTVKAPVDAPKTGLKLTLRGVFAASDAGQALAMIADARGEEKVYRKNETIFSGVILHDIFADKVILERSGNFETLSLVEGKPSRGRSPIRSSRGRPNQPKAAAPRSSGVVRTRTIQAGKRLEDLIKKLSENPAEFMADVKINPAFDEAKQVKGYTFIHKDRQTMRALGLRPGDIILEYNGQKVSDPSVLQSLFTELKSASNISLGIERNGHRENININM
ncbi:hypothetical protein MNBD_GAMMA21-1455 [hydrothermal vent metagenome]|uniref:Type II secretion system protein GspC N-terminal domain-containing protein n=1 Tax=hydrothermal vent metagenome TaxID=652676 RepID=A0A3B1A5G1_9ZZZZ